MEIASRAILNKFRWQFLVCFITEHFNIQFTFATRNPSAQLIEGNGYETRQSSLLYVIVLFLGLDPAQKTIVVYSELRN